MGNKVRERKLLLSLLDPTSFLKLSVGLQRGELGVVMTLRLECYRKWENLNDLQR